MLSLQSCHLPQRLRQFYQLPPAQQKALLDIVEEMFAMNAEKTAAAIRPVKYLQVVK